MSGQTKTLHDNAQRFTQWCRDDILPLWIERGTDRKRGGFFEQLHFDGRPDEHAVRRVRVSARQIYVFAHASTSGWLDGEDLVSWGVDYLMDTAWRADGAPGFAHLIDADGAVCDHRRDLYDHAFHILALCTAYRATQDSQILGLANETLAYVDEAMQAPNGGGWLEGVPDSLPRRQNPHMHMLEALLALYEASPDRAVLKRADEVITLFTERFLDQKTGQLYEDFDADLTAIRPARIEPGHMAEWCWLLHYRARLDETPVNELAAHMGKMADQYGQRQNGCLYSAYDEEGDLLTPTHRLWSQTEWLKSLMCRMGQDGAALAAQTADLLGRIDGLYRGDHRPGLWMDQFDQYDQPLSDHVPASIVYHLVSAAAEVERWLKGFEKEEGA